MNAMSLLDLKSKWQHPTDLPASSAVSNKKAHPEMRFFFQYGKNLRVEVKFDLGRLLNSLSIELGRFELILQHGFKGRIAEDHGAADKLRASYFPVLAYLDLHYHRAAKSAGFGNGRIRQWNSLNQLQGFQLRLLNGCR